MKLAYPIILTPFSDRSGGYTVEVPDLPGCVSEGRDLAEAMFMAEDAASLWLLTELEAGREIPAASPPSKIRAEEHGQIVSLVPLDIDAFAEKHGNKAVRKNVTIPAWLDTWAESHDINYSHELRSTLERQYEQNLAQT